MFSNEESKRKKSMFRPLNTLDPHRDFSSRILLGMYEATSVSCDFILLLLDKYKFPVVEFVIPY